MDLVGRRGGGQSLGQASRDSDAYVLWHNVDAKPTARSAPSAGQRRSNSSPANNLVASRGGPGGIGDCFGIKLFVPIVAKLERIAMYVE